MDLRTPRGATGLFRSLQGLSGPARKFAHVWADRHARFSTEAGMSSGAGADDRLSSDARARNSSPWTLAFTGRGLSAPRWAGLPVSSLADACGG
jgi:hypothetical protein